MIVGTLLALGAALLWSLANLAIQSSARRFGGFGALIWAQLIGGVAVGTAALVLEPLPAFPGGAVLQLLLLAGIAAIVAYGGLFEALRLGQVAVVTPIISSWAVLSVGYGVLAQGDPLGPLAAIGLALVVAGNTLLARSQAPQGQPGRTPPRALAMAAISALGFGTMVPTIDALGASLGRLWTIPAVWSVELALALPFLARRGLLGRRPRTVTDWRVASRVALFEAGGFVLLSLALAHAPTTLVSPAASLSTAGAVAIGLFLLHEPLPPRAILGAIAASAGVLLVNL